MANRTYNQFGGTLERRVIKLFAKISFAGSPTPVASLVTSETLFAATNPTPINPSQGFESLVDNGSGSITLVLGANNGGVPTYDAYTRLLGVNVTQVDSSSNVAVGVQVTTDDVAGSLGNPSVTIRLITTGGGPGPAPLDDGSTLLVELTLSNTSAY